MFKRSIGIAILMLKIKDNEIDIKTFAGENEFIVPIEGLYYTVGLATLPDIERFKRTLPHTNMTLDKLVPELEWLALVNPENRIIVARGKDVISFYTLKITEG